MQTLVDGLLRASPSFARFWNDHAVLARDGGARQFDHPRDGRLQCMQVTLVPATHPDHKVVMLLPAESEAGC